MWPEIAAHGHHLDSCESEAIDERRVHLQGTKTASGLNVFLDTVDLIEDVVGRHVVREQTRNALPYLRLR